MEQLYDFSIYPIYLSYLYKVSFLNYRSIIRIIILIFTDNITDKNDLRGIESKIQVRFL